MKCIGGIGGGVQGSRHPDELDFTRRRRYAAYRLPVQNQRRSRRRLRFLLANAEAGARKPGKRNDDEACIKDRIQC